MGVFNETIIPLTLVGYEMIIANSALRASLGPRIGYHRKYSLMGTFQKDFIISYNFAAKYVATLFATRVFSKSYLPKVTYKTCEQHFMY